MICAGEQGGDQDGGGGMGDQEAPRPPPQSLGAPHAHLQHLLQLLGRLDGGGGSNDGIQLLHGDRGGGGGVSGAVTPNSAPPNPPAPPQVRICRAAAHKELAEQSVQQGCEEQGVQEECRAMGQDAEQWVGMQSNGSGWRAMGQNAEQWVGMQSNGSGCRAMGQNAEQWVRMESNGSGCRAGDAQGACKQSMQDKVSIGARWAAEVCKARRATRHA